LTGPGQLVTRYVGNISSLLARCVVVWLVATILLMSSAVLYFTFHYSMMPTMLLTLPVHFQFSPCYASPAGCVFPRAQVSLMDSSAGPLLHPHVHYTWSLEMDLPESEPNKDAAGMFMVQLNLTTFSGALVGSSSRANMLHYRSWLHRTLRTLVFSPLLLTEYYDEQQRINTELFSAYLVHEDQPPTSARLELRSHTLQLYGARLRVHARLGGLRRLMYHHPLLTGALGTAATFCSLCFCFLLIWLRAGELPDTLSRLTGGRIRGSTPHPDVGRTGSARSAAADPDSTNSATSDSREADDSLSPSGKQKSPDNSQDEAVETLGAGSGVQGLVSRLLPRPLADPSGWLRGRSAEKQD